MITKRSKLYFLFIIILVILSLFLSVITHHSFKGSNDLSTIKKTYNIYNFPVSYSYGSEYFENDIKSFNDLENKSRLIVKVKATHESTLYLNSMKTKVKILKIYINNLKNQAISIESYIHVHEPISISYVDGLQSVDITDGYTLMNGDYEYILFLNNLKTIDSYKYKYDESISFIPISTKFGKYCQSELPCIYNNNEIENGEMKYNTFKNKVSILSNNQEYNLYMKIYNNVLKNDN